MADEISDERFKSEMMRLMHNAIGRFGDMDSRFRDMNNRFDAIGEQLESLKSDVRTYWAIERRTRDGD